METVKCVLGFCYDCPSEKVSQKFLRISVENMRGFFLFFALKKSLSGIETVAGCVSSSSAVVSVFLLWLFGVTYVLSVQYSFAVVSFFLLWRES